MMYPGRNASVAFYIKQLDEQNVWALARQIQQAKGEYQDVTKCWIEAVVIELMKKDLLMRFKK